MLERIAFDARYINDQYHGIGRYAFRLLEALAGAMPATTFVAVRGKGRDSRFRWDMLLARANVVAVQGPWPLYWPHEQLQWPRLLRRLSVDLFHSPYFVMPFMTRVPAVITVHDLIFDRYPNYMPRRWSRPYYRLLMQLGTRRAQRVIAVSQATARDLAGCYNVSASKILVAGEGADPSLQAAAAGADVAALRRRYQLQRPFVLSVGARRPHKNLARLVAAYARIAPRVAQDLVFAGSADERFPDEARATAQAEGLNGRVHFLGWVPERELGGLYALADVVAIPSLMEGFGLPALEAIHHGTPVLASNSSSLPEVVEEAGLLVDPYDVTAISEGLMQLLGDPSLRAQLGAAGRARASTFTWSQVAARILNAYAEIGRG